MSGQLQLRRLLRPVSGVSLTTTENEPDMITLDCSEAVRAKMPCGHVIGPQSLFDYCSNVLSNGGSSFACPDPGCSSVWDYGIVREVACLSESERQDYERRLSINSLNQTSGMKQCESCGTWCCRLQPDNDRTTCLMCTRTQGRTYDFCWNCLKEWRDGLDGTCGNIGCPATRKQILHHLANCPEKDVAGTSCPGVRACPKCGTLLEHITQCQHVKCKSCTYYFCFICLKKKNPANDGRKSPTTCGSPWACKSVAARQTSLPNV